MFYISRCHALSNGGDWHDGAWKISVIIVILNVKKDSKLKEAEYHYRIWLQFENGFLVKCHPWRKGLIENNQKCAND